MKIFIKHDLNKLIDKWRERQFDRRNDENVSMAITECIKELSEIMYNNGLHDGAGIGMSKEAWKIFINKKI